MYKIELDKEEMEILKEVLDRHFTRYLLSKAEEKLFQKIKEIEEE
jgi:hypothetical protein